MAAADTGSPLRQGERPEYSIKGPFGGVQSEVAVEEVGQYGFRDLRNMILRRGVAATRPGIETIDPMPDPQEPINGIFSFFNAAGEKISGIITPTRLLQWQGGWVLIAPAAGVSPLSGSADDLFNWAVVGHKLCFSQGVDKVKIWDGLTLTYTESVNSAPARYLAEVRGRLVIAHTLEGAGTFATQRVRWSAPGDPTDFTSFLAGQVDLFNSMGPITGILSMFQSGYIWQKAGIIQMVPTGQSIKPFDFVPMSTNSKGNYFPYSLAGYGEDKAPYIGQDNVYVFNGNSSDPIGDFPIQGSRLRVGARNRIFGDLLTSSAKAVHSALTTTLGGEPYNAYWIFIPAVGVWVFNFDEFNWTFFDYDGITQRAGMFLRSNDVRIMDLVGDIASQSWTPSTLEANVGQVETLLLGFEDGKSGIHNFSIPVERPWVAKTAPLVLGDKRHDKTLNGVRVVWTDIGPTQFFVKVTTDTDFDGQRKPVQGGKGSGEPIISFLPFKLTGQAITIQILGDPNQPLVVSEITPIYTTGMEHRAERV